jgi:Beta-galactosidase, domain 2
MKIMPVQAPITGTQLHYSTAEVLGHGRNSMLDFLIIYDEPGSLVELALESEREPQVTGELMYRWWDPRAKTVAIGLRITEQPHFLLLDKLLDRRLATRLGSPNLGGEILYE